MAKKYLLYIHEELFENEQHKSQLVNNLLERHYHDTVGGKTQPEIRAETDKKIKSVSQAKEHVGTNDLEAIRKTLPLNGNQTCPHGYGKGFCKKAECNRKYR